MEGNDQNDSKSGFPKRAILWALGVMGAGLLPVLKEGNAAGVSRLLAIIYLASWVALAGRHGLHLLEGYYRMGMGRAMACELGTLLVWGLTAALVIVAENPQIPRLVICSGGVALIFFFSSTRMEALRAREMKRRKIRIRRATEILRESHLWRLVCRSARQIDFEFARKVREFLAGPDSDVGKLSLLAVIVLFIPLVIALVSVTAVLASMVFPIPLTPPHKGPDGPEAHKGQGKGETTPDSPGTDTSPAGVPIAEDCGRDFDPKSVPQPERTSLLLGWEGVPGIEPGPMEALGFEIAGCPGRARPIPGLEDSWYAPGYCGGELKAIVVAPKGLEHPVVLLEQAAEFVLPVIEGGEFLQAVDRFPVAAGDAYIVNSRDGSYVLIRDHPSGGPVEGQENEGGCEEFSDQDVRYTIAGPGLLEAWRAVAAISIGGVYPIDYVREADGSKTVVFRSPEGIMATGFCSVTTMTCEVNIGGEQIRGRRGSFITETEVIALAEG
jgi:hypothetical protein